MQFSNYIAGIHITIYYIFTIWYVPHREAMPMWPIENWQIVMDSERPSTLPKEQLIWLIAFVNLFRIFLSRYSLMKTGYRVILTSHRANSKLSCTSNQFSPRSYPRKASLQDSRNSKSSSIAWNHGTPKHSQEMGVQPCARHGLLLCSQFPTRIERERDHCRNGKSIEAVGGQ